MIDTAGLRDAGDEVERIGVARSWSEIERADAIVFLHDLTRVGDAEYDAADAAIAGRLPARLASDGTLLDVYNKIDARPDADVAGLAISATTGIGLDGLRRRLLELVGWQPASEGLFIARARHVDALRRARGHLDAAARHADAGNATLELLAEELRLGHDALGAITGTFTSEDLLGAIFGRFCIGK